MSDTRTLTFTKPSYKLVRRDRIHGGKFFAVIALAILAAFAGYQGWIKLPSLTALGGVAGLVVLLAGLALMFIAVNTDKVWARNIALFAALVIGGLIAANWPKISKAFISFGWSDFLGLLVAAVITIIIATWCSLKSEPVIKKSVLTDDTQV